MKIHFTILKYQSLSCNLLNVFTGSLALIDLGSVNVTSKNVMTAIGSLCTCPQAVTLFSSSYSNEFSGSDNLDCTCDECLEQFWDNDCSDDEDPPRSYRLNQYRDPDPIISQEKLRSILKREWPKVMNFALL